MPSPCSHAIGGGAGLFLLLVSGMTALERRVLARALLLYLPYASYTLGEKFCCCCRTSITPDLRAQDLSYAGFKTPAEKKFYSTTDNTALRDFLFAIETILLTN